MGLKKFVLVVALAAAVVGCAGIHTALKVAACTACLALPASPSGAFVDRNEMF